ncbi:MAG: autotransporter-associated beta strand repeat-containing protein [Verrucomicrobiota bacterium]
MNYSGGAYQQNFDALPATGSSISWVDNSTLPGWYAWISALNSPPVTIILDTGTSTTSTVLHDYGSNGSTNRALGLLSYSTTSGDVLVGVRLRNTGAETYHSFTIHFDGEQWRCASAAVHPLTCSFTTDTPANLGDFTVNWQCCGQLNFCSPVTSSNSFALDGTLAPNRTPDITASVGGFSWAPGTDLWVRFNNPNLSPGSHGLALDNFVFSASTNAVSGDANVPADLYNEAIGSVNSLDYQLRLGAAVTVAQLPHAAYIALALNYPDPVTAVTKAQSYLNQMFTMQDTNPVSSTFGQLLWTSTDTNVIDRNSIEFSFRPLGALLKRYADRLGTDYINSIKPMILTGLSSSRARNVSTNYSNIYTMRIANWLMLGEALGDTTTYNAGLSALNNWITDLGNETIHEYDSAGYSMVTYNNLITAANNVTNPVAADQLRALANYLATDLSANYFKGQSRLGGSHSRDYDFMNGNGAVDHFYYLAGLQAKLPSLGSFNEGIYTYLNGVEKGNQPPLDVVAWGNSWSNRIVKSVWGPTNTPGQDRYHYLTPDFSIGSSGRYYNVTQDKAIAADFNSTSALPQVSLVYDPYDAPYGTIKVLETGSGHMKQNHLYFNSANVQDRGTILSLATLAPNFNIAANWLGPYTNLSSAVVFPAQADAIYLDGVALNTNIATSGSVVGIQEGNAVIAARFYRVDGLAGYVPTYAVKFDGGAAARFVAYHYQGLPTTFDNTYVSNRAMVGAIIAARLCTNALAVTNFLNEVKMAAVTLATNGNQSSASVTIGGTTLATTLDASSGVVVSRMVNGTNYLPQMFSINDGNATTRDLFNERYKRMLSSGWIWTPLSGVTNAAATYATNGAAPVTTVTSGDALTTTPDAGVLVHRAFTGDAEVSARVNQQSDTSTTSLGGVALRETLDAGACGSVLGFSGSSGVRFLWRTTNSGPVLSITNTAFTSPGWLRLRRVGNVVSAAYRADAGSWQPVGSDQIVVMNTTLYGGLAAAGGTPLTPASTVFSNAVGNVIAPLASTTTLVRHAGTGTNSTYGDALQFEVTVSPAAASGMVVIREGGQYGTDLGTGYLTTGTTNPATVTITALNALTTGTHTNIVAYYYGDATYLPSVSAALSAQMVGPKTLTISSPAASNKSYDGTTVANVTGSLNGVVSGDVPGADVFLLGYFANTGPGTNIAVASFFLGGVAAANYSLTPPGHLAADIVTTAIWNTAASGQNWSTAANWVDNAIGDGQLAAADFMSVNLTNDPTVVHLDSPRTLQTLVFGDPVPASAASWVLDNNGVMANTLTLAGTAPQITVNALAAGRSATIGTVVAGTSGLTKAGSGTLILANHNSYTGGTMISAGTLQIGVGVTPVIMAGGNITNNGVLVFNRPDSVVVTNTISGSGSVIQGSTNALTLAGTNTYAGGTTVTNLGSLLVTNAGALGTGPLNLQTRATGPSTTFQVTGGLTITNAINMDSTTGRELINAMGGNNTLSGPITITGNGNTTVVFQDNDPVNTGTTLTFSNTITASTFTGQISLRGNAGNFGRLAAPVYAPNMRMDFNGNANWIIASTNNVWSYLGFAVAANNGGWLICGAVNCLPSGTRVNWGSGSSNILDLAGYNQTIGGLDCSTTTTTAVTNSSATSDAVLTINSGANSYTFSGTIKNGATHRLALTILGGTTTLTGSNTYSGNTMVGRGKLIIQQPTLDKNSTVVVSNGAILQLGFSATNQVGALVLNGVSKPLGVYNNTTDPTYLAGTGSLLVGGVFLPVISGSTTFTNFITSYGLASAAQNFAVTGTNLTTDITATAAPGFEVSTNSGTPYDTTATLANVGGFASGQIYIRLSATATAGSYNASNIVVLTSLWATDVTNTSTVAGNVVNQATPVLTINATPIGYNQALSNSSLAASVATNANNHAQVLGDFSFATPAIVPSLGTTNVVVMFTPFDSTNYTSVTTNVIVTFNQAFATVTLSNLRQPYNGMARPVGVSSAPSGLAVGLTYSNASYGISSRAPTNTGSYTVIGTVNDLNYYGSATNTLIIGSAALHWAVADGIWDSNTSLNWKDAPDAGVADACYLDGDAVILDDSASGVPPINVTNSVVVWPSSILVNVTNKSYNLSGNAITGTAALTKNGPGTLALASSNSCSGNLTINGGVLMVTNGGTLNSPQATLNIGAQAGANGTLVLANSPGGVTVQKLLATNVVCGGPTNSIFNFNGGTLTTSNSNGLASSILLASNVSWTVNGNWNMNGGTNLISSVATNGNPSAYVYVGNGTNNVLVSVNANTVWWLTIPTNSFATNNLSLTIGSGNATNNVVTINGGTLIVTNAYGLNGGTIPIIVGGSGGAAGNQLVITNGGQVFTKVQGNGNPQCGNIGGSTGPNNSLIVAGTNVAGRKATWNFGADRLSIGFGNGSSNWALVGQGGVITNVNIFTYGKYSSLFITNGGQVFAAACVIGRGALNANLVVAGADVSGSPALLAFPTAGTLTVGGGSATPTSPAPGTNTLAVVGPGGLVTNAGSINVGQDTNSIGNLLAITNGGKVFSTSNSAIGFVAGCNSNSVSVGGGVGASLWSLGNAALTLGNNANATNNSLTLLGGGVLSNVSSVTLGGVNSRLSFNGGTLAAGTNGNLINTNNTVFNATSYVQTGGAVIDSVGFTVTNRLPLLEDPGSPGGRLTKLGSGTLSLLGTNNYSGGTSISAGTLALAGNGSLANTPSISIAAGAVLNVSGITPGGYTLTGSTPQQILSASSSFGVATVNATGKVLTLAPGALATFKADGAAGTVGKISVTGNLALNANAITVDVLNAVLPVGTNRLLGCSGTLVNSGQFGAPAITGMGLGSGKIASLNVVTGAAGYVELQVAATVPGPGFPANGIIVLPGGVVSLAATGTVGAAYRLWAGTNLATAPLTNSWMMLTNGTLTVSPITIQDPAATNYPRRFYRFSSP